METDGDPWKGTRKEEADYLFSGCWSPLLVVSSSPIGTKIKTLRKCPEWWVGREGGSSQKDEIMSCSANVKSASKMWLRNHRSARQSVIMTEMRWWGDEGMREGGEDRQTRCQILETKTSCKGFKPQKQRLVQHISNRSDYNLSKIKTTNTDCWIEHQLMMRKASPPPQSPSSPPSSLHLCPMFIM